MPATQDQELAEQTVKPGSAAGLDDKALRPATQDADDDACNAGSGAGRADSQARLKWKVFVNGELWNLKKTERRQTEKWMCNECRSR